MTRSICRALSRQTRCWRKWMAYRSPSAFSICISAETFSGLLLPNSKRDLAGLEDLLLLAREAARRGIDREPLTMARLGHARRGLALTALEKISRTGGRTSRPRRLSAHRRRSGQPAGAAPHDCRPFTGRGPGTGIIFGRGRRVRRFGRRTFAQALRPAARYAGRPGQYVPLSRQRRRFGLRSFRTAFSASYLRDVPVWPQAIEPAVAGLAPGR